MTDTEMFDRIFYRPPKVNDFLNIFQMIFNKLTANEIYLPRGFNVNLLQNGKFNLKENQSCKVKNSISALVNKYKEFCQSLTEIIKDRSGPPEVFL